MKIDERIKRLREEYGFTQYELGERAGLARGTIQQYECRKRSPGIEQLLMLSKAFGLSLSELVKDVTE